VTTSRKALLAAAGAIGLYGAGLVVAGPLAAGLFDALGFGMATAGIAEGPARDHVLFVYGVLGAVLAGWMVAVAGLVLDRGLPALAASVGTWFVLDTGFSLAVGSWRHALFNLVFLLALGGPLLARVRARRQVSTLASS
jgi:hypothetical protein